MTKLAFADLHSPLFLGGRNFGMKLDGKKITGLQMLWDHEKDVIWISYNGKTSAMPLANVISMEPGESLQKEEIPVQPVPHQGKIKAQVSSPTSHVFAGEKR